MLEGVLKRIDLRLEAVGLSAAAASRAAKLSPDAIRNMQRSFKKNPKSGASIITIYALAPVLKTTASYLMEGGNADLQIDAIREKLIQKHQIDFDTLNLAISLTLREMKRNKSIVLSNDIETAHIAGSIADNYMIISADKEENPPENDNT